MKKKKLFVVQVVLLAIFAGSVLAMYFTDKLNGENIYNMVLYINAAVFWLSLILFIMISCMINRNRKKDNKRGKHRRKSHRVGLVNFFQNKPAIIMDCIMILSIVLLIILTKINIQEIFWAFCNISILIFSFGMHCILNGINYSYIKDKKGEENV